MQIFYILFYLHTSTNHLHIIDVVLLLLDAYGGGYTISFVMIEHNRSFAFKGHSRLGALAPLIRLKEVSAAVTRVLPAMKRNSGLGALTPSRVTTVPWAKLMAQSER
jgi:hypothetical protein